MEYEPELGQMAFGQPWKEYEVPEIWEAALSHLSDELRRVMWNRTQEEYPSPFWNTSERFDCPAFSAHAYSWSVDDQPWNFKWRDVEISWYKWMGRGMSSNMQLTPDMAAEMLGECLPAVRSMDDNL